MQFTKLAVLAVVVASSVTAQVSISNLPTCALSPAVQAIGTTTCGSNIACVCQDTSFLTSLIPLIQAACSPADFQAAVSVAVQLCAENGVTITVPNFASSTSAPASVASSPASVVSTTPASTTHAATTAAASSTTLAATNSAAAVSTTTSAPKNGTISTSAVPSVVTANAAAAHGTWAAAGLLGVGALLAAF